MAQTMTCPELNLVSAAPAPQMVLRPYQDEFISAVEGGWSEWKKQLGVAPTGCHDPSQPILKHNGEIVPAGNVRVGDLLIGRDGNPRNVIAIHHGFTEMVRVTPTKGEPFIVTLDHPLTLVRTNDGSIHSGRLIDVRVCDWLNWNSTLRHIHKLMRVPVRAFSPNPQTNLFDDCIHPYLIGVMLGDGCLRDNLSLTSANRSLIVECQRLLADYRLELHDSGSNRSGLARSYMIRDIERNRRARIWFRRRLDELGINNHHSGNKFIPTRYKVGTFEDRRQVLAGLMDTDGSLACSGFDFVSKSPTLANDTAFVARSIGLAAYVSSCRKGCQTGAVGTYYRVSISGDCSIIPCRIERKQSPERAQKKSVLRTGFSVQRIGPGPYAGFTVDGDSRYLMGDFTLTHNSGKTILFSNLAKRLFDRTGQRTLILAHRDELIDQAIDKLRKATGIVAEKEKAECRATFDAPVVVASVQTMIRRLDRWPRDHFGLVVCDEAHHTLADSWRKVIDHFCVNGTSLLGVTATPDRGDKKSLREIFENIACEIKLLDLIKQGYLCPITIRSVPLKIDLTQVQSIAGDLDAGQIGSIIEPYLDQIARAMKEHIGDRKTLAFLPLISTSFKFVDSCRAVGLSAVHIDGESPDRKEILARYDKGEFQVLSNAMLLLEGYDQPDVSCIVMLRPTRVRPLFAQAVGRGTRIAPGKKDLLLLDFLWLHERHNIVHPASLIAKDEEEAEAITAFIEDSGGEEGLLDAARDVAAEREAALRARLKALANRRAKFISVEEWAVNHHLIEVAEFEPTMRWHEDAITPKQLEWVEKAGVDPASLKGKGHASAVLDAYFRMRDQEPASHKQRWVMRQHGWRSKDGTRTAAEATRKDAIDFFSELNKKGKGTNDRS